MVDKSASSTNEKATPSRTFQATWARGRPFIVYNKDENLMYCSICRDARKNNAMAKGTNNFRSSTVERHIECQDHQLLVNSSKGKHDFQVVSEKAHSKQEEAVMIALKCVFWLVKEDLPLHKYTSLMTFLRELKVPNIESLYITDKLKYESETSAYGMLEALSNVIDKSLTSKLQNSPTITLLTDESTDIVVNHKLAINVTVVDPLTLAPKTHFVRC